MNTLIDDQLLQGLDSIIQPGPMPVWLEHVLARKTPDIREQALLFLQQRNWDRALVAWQNLLEEEPENKGVLTTVAELYLKKEQRERAYGLLEKVVQLSLQEKKINAAVALWRRIALLVPTDLTPRERLIRLLAQAYAEHKDSTQGNNFRDQALVELRALVSLPPSMISEKVRIDYLRSISRLDPRDFGTLIRAASMMKARGLPRQARDFLYDTAERLIKRKLVSAAEKVIHEALQIEPGDTDLRALFFLAQVYKGMEVQAVQGLERMHMEQPDNLAVVLALARAAKAMKRPVSLTDWLIEAFRLDTEQAQVLVDNAMRLRDQGEYEQALRLCLVLAESESRQGRVMTSVELLNRLLEKAPDFLPARQHLVRYFMLAERRSEAAHALERVFRQYRAEGNEDDFQIFLLKILTEFPMDAVLSSCARRLQSS